MASLHMTPRFPADDFRDVDLTDAVLSGEIDLPRPIGVSGSDCANVVISQLGVTIGLASSLFGSEASLMGTGRSSLRDTISDVLPLRSKPQMRGVDAPRMIACVEHGESVGHGTLMFEFPRNPVGAESLSVQPDASVPVFVAGTVPRPAFVWPAEVNLLRESLAERAGTPSVPRRRPNWDMSMHRQECITPDGGWS